MCTLYIFQIFGFLSLTISVLIEKGINKVQSNRFSERAWNNETEYDSDFFFRNILKLNVWIFFGNIRFYKAIRVYYGFMCLCN